MKRLLLISLATLAFSTAPMPAAQRQPSAGSAPPSQAVGKRTPQAKTHPEFNDYNAAYAITGGAQMEKAADEFATKYPASELRSYLYAKAMHEYQSENNSGKMLAMGEKVLALDADNLAALAITASVLADNLSEGDQDRQQKINEIKKNSSHVLQTMDTAFVPPANATPEQVTAYKNMLRSIAHSALGITALKSSDDAGAEKELKMAADLSQTDPFNWYHLALAQDHQKKYSEALASVEQALRNIGSNSDLGRLASGERARLMTLTGTTPFAFPPQAQPQPSPSSSRPPL